MTHIDFYILRETTRDASWLFACRLVEKVYKLGMDVLVTVDSEADAVAFDSLLWAFKPESFIPHQLLGQTPAAPVEISFDENAGDHRGLLINLSSRVPSPFSRFERLAEIVAQEETILTTSRERFAFYKGRGYPIETRKM